MPRDPLLTVRQAAERLGISGRRVRWLISHNRLKAEHVDWMWLIRESELERFAALDRPVGKPKTA